MAFFSNFLPLLSNDEADYDDIWGLRVRRGAAETMSAVIHSISF